MAGGSRAGTTTTIAASCRTRHLHPPLGETNRQLAPGTLPTHRQWQVDRIQVLILDHEVTAPGPRVINSTQSDLCNSGRGLRDNRTVQTGPVGRRPSASESGDHGVTAGSRRAPAQVTGMKRWASDVDGHAFGDWARSPLRRFPDNARKLTSQRTTDFGRVRFGLFC